MTIHPTQTQVDLVVAGVDTHQRTHHVVVLDARGAVLGDRQVDANVAGYRQLLDFVASHGLVDQIGVESTGSYGAGLTRFLIGKGVQVVEVNRPAKQTRARLGKSDPIDAESAARQVLAGVATATPKDTTGVIESIRILKITRDSAVKARTAAMMQMRDIILTAPAELRDQVDGMTSRQRKAACLALRPDNTRLADPTQAAKKALLHLARRIRSLDEEVADLDQALETLVVTTAPRLLTLSYVGTHSAAQLLVTAGQNIERMTSEGSFARLTGVAPIPASSGKTNRMRLSRGGDRQANKAIHMVAVGRLRLDPRSREYMTRRQTEGLSKKDILRCLKRYTAREIYYALKTDLQVDGT